MKNKCVIFDFDGTIADTTSGIFNSIRYASEKMGLRTLNNEELKSHIGPPMHEAYNKNFGLSGAELEKAIDYHKEYSLSIGYKEFEFYKGMIEVLGKLRGAVITWASQRRNRTPSSKRYAKRTTRIGSLTQSTGPRGKKPKPI